MIPENRNKPISPWRLKLYEIIFEAETPAGKTFDVGLLVAIILSVLTVILESVEEYHQLYAIWFFRAEWFFTVIFSIEYFLRIICVRKPLNYIFSFYGVIDLLSILPTFISIFVGGWHSLLVIRTIRLIRVFRIFKMVRFVGEGAVLLKALRASRVKITVFLVAVLALVVIFGTLMYLLEGAENGFTSIPRSIYWAIVTLTTVGYGDIAPHTVAGQTVASLIMIMGYGIIAVPTGIVTAELAHSKKEPHLTTQTCPHCLGEGHDGDAVYCKYCGDNLQYE